MDTDEVLEHVRRLQSMAWIIAVFFTMVQEPFCGHGGETKIEQLVNEKLASVAADLRISSIAFETHEAIVITDCHPKILRVNQAFQDITGYTAEEVIGHNPNILSAERKPKAFYDEMWAAIFRDGKWSGEMLDKRKNGEIYPKWLTITAVTARMAHSPITLVRF